MSKELITMSFQEWNALMGEYHIKVAHDYFADMYFNTKTKPIKNAISARLNNINVNFEFILKTIDAKWTIEELDKLNNRMKGVCEIDAYIYTCSDEERNEILNLIKTRVLARKNKLK